MDTAPACTILISALSALPALLGALVGALVALIGVRWQIVADRVQKRDEQIFNMRREAYTEVSGVLNYSFLRGQALSDALKDPNLKTQINLHVGNAFSRARLVASPQLREVLYELYQAEMRLWEPENTGKNTNLSNQRGELVKLVESLMRKDLGTKD
jgi:hypothetical protein